MTDRELLTLAAKAADLVATPEGDVLLPAGPATGEWRVWNPLTDDGDALRLAARLRMNVRHEDPAASAAGWAAWQLAPTVDGSGPWYWKEWTADNADPLAATRRAIVRAAAAIGEKQ